MRGDVLRRIALALPLPGGGPSITDAFQIRLRGARVEGMVRLEDAAAREGVSLVLEECEIPEALVLKNSRLMRLSLAGSLMKRLEGDGVVVDGPVDLSGVHPISDIGVKDSEPGTCWIEFRGARIAGGVRAEGAHFCAPPPRKLDPSRDRSRYALDLTGAVVEGPVSLSRGCLIDGGVSFREARISGDVQIWESKVRALEGYAVDGQFMVADRSVRFHASGLGEDRAMTISGCVWLYGARIASGLHFYGVEIDRKPSSQSEYAVVLASAHLGELRVACTPGSQDFKRSLIEGGIWAGDVVVDGGVKLNGSKLVGGRREAIAFTGARVGGDLSMTGAGTWLEGSVQLQRFQSRGVVSISRTTIGGNLQIDEADLYGDELTGELTVRLTRVGRGMTCRARSSVPIAIEDCWVAGDLEFDSGESGQHLELIQRGNLSGISLAGTEVEGVLSMRRLTVHRVGDTDHHLQSAPEVARAIEDGSVSGVRLAPLQYYPGWSLCELLVPTPEGPAVASLLWDHEREAAVLLDGTSAPIHAVNLAGVLRLRDASDASAYVAFFSGHVWADDGGFIVLGGESGVGTPVKAERDGDGFTVGAMVQYEGRLFRCQYRVAPGGGVAMEDDEEVGAWPSTAVFDPPLRRGKPPAKLERWPTSPLVSGLDWHEGSLETWKPLLLASLGRDALPESHGMHARLMVDLRGLSVGMLRDNHGVGWGSDVHLRLDGISIGQVASSALDDAWNERRNTPSALKQLRRRRRGRRWAEWLGLALGMILVPVALFFFLALAAYAWGVRIVATVTASMSNMRRISGAPRPPESAGSVVARWTGQAYPFPSTAAWRARRQWLSSQYLRYRPNRLEYNPEPYAQVAAAYRAQGRLDDARRLTSLRLRTERRVGALVWRPFLWLYGVFFDHGLSPKRAIATTIGLVLLGWAATEYANEHDLLVIETTASATVAVERPAGPTGGSVLVPGALIAPSATARPALPCGDAISPFLYAMDVFIPLLDLRQEFRCHVGRAEYRETEAEELLRSPKTWLVLKAAYSLLGWIVISLTILTVSGVLRRQAES